MGLGALTPGPQVVAENTRMTTPFSFYPLSCFTFSLHETPSLCIRAWAEGATTSALFSPEAALERAVAPGLPFPRPVASEERKHKVFWVVCASHQSQGSFCRGNASSGCQGTPGWPGWGTGSWHPGDSVGRVGSWLNKCSQGSRQGRPGQLQSPGFWEQLHVVMELKHKEGSPGGLPALAPCLEQAWQWVTCTAPHLVG